MTQPSLFNKFPGALSFIETLEFEKQVYPNDKKLLNRATNSAVKAQMAIFNSQKVFDFDDQMIEHCGEQWFE